MPFINHLEETLTETDVLELQDEECRIILCNDNYNTFDYVIGTPVQMCDHIFEQAEQCAIIIHFKGKCDVKTSSYDYPKPLCVALLDAGLSTEVEE